MQQTQPTTLEYAQPQDLIGKRVGSYVIVRSLGAGGMGAVYLAEHREVGQKAAVKVLHAEISRDEVAARRFFEEARAVSLADHPGLVKLFDFNKLPDGRLYLLMEYVPGESLFQRMDRLRQQGALMDLSVPPSMRPWVPVVAAARIVRQIASVLRHAHERGVIHRDIKPENILLSPDLDHPGQDRARLVDFGIAKLKDGHRTNLTRDGSLLGTPLYMAPEQIDLERPLGPATDIYALGVTFYELCARQVPFNLGSLEAVIFAHLQRQPRPLRDIAPEVPAPIAALIHKMLAKDGADRPTAAEVVTELDTFLLGGAAGDEARSGPAGVAAQEPAGVAPAVVAGGRALWPMVGAAVLIGFCGASAVLLGPRLWGAGSTAPLSAAADASAVLLGPADAAVAESARPDAAQGPRPDAAQAPPVRGDAAVVQERPVHRPSPKPPWPRPTRHQAEPAIPDPIE